MSTGASNRTLFGHMLIAFGLSMALAILLWWVAFSTGTLIAILLSIVTVVVGTFLLSFVVTSVAGFSKGASGR